MLTVGWMTNCPMLSTYRDTGAHLAKASLFWTALVSTSSRRRCLLVRVFLVQPSTNMCRLSRLQSPLSSFQLSWSSLLQCFPHPLYEGCDGAAQIGLPRTTTTNAGGWRGEVLWGSERVTVQHSSTVHFTSFIFVPNSVQTALDTAWHFMARHVTLHFHPAFLQVEELDDFGEYHFRSIHETEIHMLLGAAPAAGTVTHETRKLGQRRRSPTILWLAL